MIIYFVRHASAGEHLTNPKKDEKRPLDSDGIEQCGFVGRALAALNVQPELIVSSPLKRATQTAALIANEIGYEGELELEPALRPEASFADFRRLLDKYAKQEAVMVVGHNPSITDFLSRMISQSAGEALIDFKKGAVARAETARRSATLNWLLTPKMARAIQAAAAEKSQPKTSRK
ncbi:MAG: phosphohistidine phosphatase SixA [Acidobacteria bacterium]|nr:phosphohistidine phosphatase SixA [Acidobacteriota bacterium]